MVEHMLHARALKAAAEWRDDEVAAKRARQASAEPPAEPPVTSGGRRERRGRLTERLRLAPHAS